MEMNVKRILFKEGKFTCTVPCGDTSAWTVSRWISWIDCHGQWLM